MSVVLFIAVLTYVASNVSTDTDDAFEVFVKIHRKNYHPATAEYFKRRAIFLDSIRRVEWLNRNRSNDEGALYGITQFSDLTPQEFNNFVIRAWKPVKRPQRNRWKREITDFKNIEGIPQKVDWREKGIIGKIRNQDKCGACWAFSTVATIESMLAMKTEVLEELSVQQMIDCSDVNHGCDGGDTCGALEWLSNNDIALTTEKNYPFRDETDEICRMKPKTGIKIRSNYTCFNFTDQEEEILKILANHGPVAAAVDATGWQDYLGGIIQYHCDTKRNHAVQIVGYDLTGEIPHYIIRNSWGTKFGIDGYIKIAIGKDLCAIAEEISALSVQVDTLLSNEDNLDDDDDFNML